MKKEGALYCLGSFRRSFLLVSVILCWLSSIYAAPQSTINFNFEGMVPPISRTCSCSPCPSPSPSPPPTFESFDYLVVGAGAGGGVVASRLSEDPSVTVLLLERGGTPTQQEELLKLVPRYQWEQAVTNPIYAEVISSDPHPDMIDRRTIYYEGRSFGGTTNIYGGIHARPNLNEFAAWNVSWAQDEADVLEYFKKTETNPRGEPFHGTSGPLVIHLEAGPDEGVDDGVMLQAAANLGIPVAEDSNDGYHGFGVGYVDRALKFGQKESSFTAYIEPVLPTRPNLVLRSRAQVIQVLTDGEGNALGVVYLDAAGEQQTVLANKEVILSAGVHNSPKILMLSGIGPQADLAQLGITVVQDLPGVGQNYQERPRFNMVFYSALLDPGMNFTQIYSEEAILNWLETGVGPLTKGLSSASGYFGFPENPTFHFEFTSVFPFQENVVIPPSSYLYVCSPAHVASRGEVYLESSDPLADIRIVPNFFSNQLDMAAVLECGALARQLAQTPPLNAVTLEELLPGAQASNEEQLAGYVLSTAASTYHAAGTCKMSDPATDALAVVDENFVVVGFNNLRVVDGSVLPLLTPVNPSATIYMVAEKAADVIKQQNAAKK